MREPGWAGRLELASWHLKRTMYNFKNSFSLNFVSISRVEYVFPETCFAYTISETEFTE